MCECVLCSVFDIVAKSAAGSSTTTTSDQASDEQLVVVLVDVVATDAGGDVAFAPLRIQRFASQPVAGG